MNLEKAISFILIFTLLFTSLPLDGIVALAEQAIEDSKLITVEKEIKQYRTEFTKTYLKSDGTLESVVSAAPIHFKENGEEVLKNKKRPFDVEFQESQKEYEFQLKPIQSETILAGALTIASIVLIGVELYLFINGVYIPFVEAMQLTNVVRG